MRRAGITDVICLVTGAAQGIGEATARQLAAHGAKLALIDENEEGVEKLACDLSFAGTSIIAQAVDVRDTRSIDVFVERIEHELGPIGVLVNAAGILRTGPTASCDLHDWHEIFSVNAAGVFIVSRAVAQRMLPRRSGAIVTIGSNAATMARMNMAAYAASKAASAQFTKCLALELAPFGIRCNVVSPGSTDTPMQRSLWNNSDDYHRIINGCLDEFRSGIPLNRLALASDIADAVIFLASDSARHITMHDLRVDGGATLGG